MSVVTDRYSGAVCTWCNSIDAYTLLDEALCHGLSEVHNSSLSHSVVN
jgi:hypothetical protein